MTVAVTSPERSCVGCRARRPQADLVRLTCDEGRVVPAWPGAPGRGAYVCPDEACLEAAERKRAFARAFRGPVIIDPAVRQLVARRANGAPVSPGGDAGAAGGRKVVR